MLIPAAIAGAIAAALIAYAWWRRRKREQEKEDQRLEDERRRPEPQAQQPRSQPPQERVVKPPLLTNEEIIRQLLDHVPFNQEWILVGHRVVGERIVGMDRTEVQYPTDLVNVRQMRTPAELPLRLPSERTAHALVQLVRAVSGDALVIAYEEDVPRKEPVLEPEYRLKRKLLYVLLDTSGSMFGMQWNGWAKPIWKNFVARLLQGAIQNEAVIMMRRFTDSPHDLVLMNTPEQVEPVVARILALEAEGGTNITVAIEQAIDDLKTQSFDQADILIISDGQDDNLRPQVIREKLDSAGARLHAIMFAENNRGLMQAADSYRCVPRLGVLEARVVRST